MHLTSLEKYDRQTRIKGWNQQKLTDARVMVLGAGALGNEIVKNLALIGVGSLLVVDFDNIELSNLSRTVLFSQEDIGESKAKTLALAAQRLNPQIAVNFIHGDILFDIGLGFYRNVDLIIGGLDNLAARAHANSLSVLAGKPYLDSGVWDHGGEVKWFFPLNSVCFECLLSEHDRNTIAVRCSCTGFKAAMDESAPIIVSSTLAPVAIVAGIAVQEACYYFTEMRQVNPGEAIVYNGLQITLHRSILPRNPHCLNHINGPYTNVHKLTHSVHGITAMHIMQIASRSLGSEVTVELGRDYLSDLYCETCNRSEPINDLISRIPEERIYCPNCTKKRKKNVFTSISNRDDLSDRSLAALGLPIGEVVVVRSKLGVEFYELNGDVRNFFSNKQG